MRSRVASAGISAKASLHATSGSNPTGSCLVTSANVTETAQERNIELGLLASSAPVANQIEGHFRGLINWNHLRRLPLRNMSEWANDGSACTEP